MQALLLEQIGSIEPGVRLLRMADVPLPQPAPGEVLLRVNACGVCHTELDEIEGRLAPPRLPTVLGHQIVGRVPRSVRAWSSGKRVIAPLWRGFTRLAAGVSSAARNRKIFASSFRALGATATADMLALPLALRSSHRRRSLRPIAPRANAI